MKNRERGRERFLSEEEFRRLARALAEAETGNGMSVHAVAAIWLLLLTGLRRNEILALRWRDVDLDAREIKLEDSKTGARAWRRFRRKRPGCSPEYRAWRETRT